MATKPNTPALRLDFSSPAMADEGNGASKSNGTLNPSVHTSARASSSPLRHRPLGRASTFADNLSPQTPRRSSLFSESVDEARQSIKSSTDNLLLPRATSHGFDAHHEPSHWHSAPLALALLPAVGGLFFQNGSAVVTDMTLLGLAAVFLNWSVRLPWDWYCQAQSVRLETSNTSADSYPGNTIIEEGSEDEGSDAAGSPASDARGTSPPSGKSNTQRPAGHEEAESELRKHEITALLACFIFPLIGAWLLHAIRSQLSRPSEGLVSNYNLTIFLLASELRPLSHLVRMVQARTLYLQRVVSKNPFAEDKVDKDKLLDVAKRLDELEAHVAEKSVTNPSNGSANPANTSQVATEVRKSIQPELDALNRAVRRYEKRATILTMQTEARLRDIESRMSDAITLAAAAERSNSQSRQGTALVLLDWACAAVVLPVQATWSALSLPGRIAAKALGLVEGYIGGKPPTALLPTTNHRQDILTTASSSFAERHPTTSPHAIQGQPPAELLTTIQEPAPEPEPEPEPSAQASKRPSFPNRIVRGSLPRALFRTSRQFRRPPAASLWNPINSSPRSTGPHNTIPSVSFEHSNPDQTLPLSAGKDEYPLLTLPEQRRSRRGSPNSLFAEHSAISDNPGSPTRIAVPHHTHQHGHPQSSVSKGKQPIRYGAPPPSTMEGPLPVSSPVHSKELQVDLERGPRSIHSHPSHHSIRTNTTHASHRLPSPTNSIAWGPSHPCFPHPNPHVPLSSPLYKSTRIVRIRRDWTICGDLAPTFTNTYPEILSPWVSEQDFRILITKVNEILIRTFDPWSTRNWLDGLLGLLTGWFWDDLGLTGVKKGVREVEGVVEGWNKERVDEGIDGDDEGEFKVISLRRTGFMSLDFQIPDPHIDRIDPDATSRAGTRPSTAAANGGNPRSGGAASVVNEEETQRERERARGRERERERERDSDMEKIAENL